MSSKIGLLLSLIFVTLFFMLGIDMMTIQFYYSDLDSKGINISYYISKNGRIDDPFISDLENRYQVSITDLSKNDVRFGDIVEFVVSREYKPIIISKDELTIKVKRSAVIGYYG